MKIYKISEKLPNEGEYVLIWCGKSPWGGGDESRFWKVATIVKGISEEEREQMRLEYEANPTNDKCELVRRYNGEYEYVPKYKSYSAGDVHGNNLVPYCWEEFGVGNYNGQEIRYWTYLPTKDIKEQYGDDIYNYNPYKLE